MTTYGPYDATFVDTAYNDGDTFSAVVTKPDLDFGFHVFVHAQAQQKFRLNRCNAAPIGTDSGAGAAAYLKSLLDGVPLSLLSVGSYKYGDEWMAEVTLPDGRNVTDVMIAEQWAAPWDGRSAQPLPPWPRTVA